MKKLIWLLLVVTACTKSPENTGKIEIIRFDQELMACQTKEALIDLLSKNKDLTLTFYGKSVTDTAFIAGLYHTIQHPEAIKLYEQALETFGDLSKLSEGFYAAFSEIENLYPEFKAPKVVTTFSGLNNDMIISDSLVVISIESFIGPKANFSPDQPDYILSRMTPQHILPQVIRFLSNQFNKTNFDNDTFLADMVFFGKQLEFCRQVLPNTPDSLIIGYTNREMQNAYEHQDYIWAHLIDRQLLNNENPTTNAKYFGERPYVAEISPDCPPRIGQWLGLRVVELYMRNNKNLSIRDLMQTDDPEVILRGSKYRGQKDE